MLHGVIPVALSFEWHYSVDRSALICQQLRRHRDIVPAKRTSSLHSFLPKSTLMGLLKSSAPLFQLAFTNERRFSYRRAVNGRRERGQLCAHASPHGPEVISKPPWEPRSARARHSAIIHRPFALIFYLYLPCLASLRGIALGPWTWTGPRTRSV